MGEQPPRLFFSKLNVAILGVVVPLGLLLVLHRRPKICWGGSFWCPWRLVPEPTRGSRQKKQRKLPINVWIFEHLSVEIVFFFQILGEWRPRWLFRLWLLYAATAHVGFFGLFCGDFSRDPRNSAENMTRTGSQFRSALSREFCVTSHWEDMNRSTRWLYKVLTRIPKEHLQIASAAREAKYFDVCSTFVLSFLLVLICVEEMPMRRWAKPQAQTLRWARRNQQENLWRQKITALSLGITTSSCATCISGERRNSLSPFATGHNLWGTAVGQALFDKKHLLSDVYK